MGYFSGYFEETSTFLTPKLFLAALWAKYILLEMAHKIICTQKNNLPHFQNQLYSNSYYALRLFWLKPP
jgi:hypothetical protein